MNLSTSIIIFTVAAMLGCQAGAQIYDTNGDFVQTFAGSGFSGHVDGQGTQTMFNNPTQIVADSSGNLFVLDAGNFCIRKITPNGTVSTFVGGGSSLPAYGTNVSLSQFGTLKAMTIDHSNVLWIAAGLGASILRIGSDGYTTSQTNGPWECDYGAICVDSSNNIYFSDSESNRIYKYQTNGTLQVFAGSGNLGSQDGNGIFTSFNSPGALASDAADNIYVFDFGNHLIRRINPNADVVTIAGNGTSGGNLDGQGLSAAFNEIYSMCFDNAGNIIMASGFEGPASVREMAPSTNIVTLAGSFHLAGYTNGSGNTALFNTAQGVCISMGTIYVADTGNERIRSVTNNPQPQIVSTANLQMNTYPGLQITGTVGRTYQVQSSSDMTNWTTRTTLLLNSSPYLWIDQNPVSGSKFYRALLLP